MSSHLQTKDMTKLKELGGVDSLAKSLMSSTTKGLDPAAGGDASIEARANYYGKNEIPAKPPVSFWALMYANMKASR